MENDATPSSSPLPPPLPQPAHAATSVHPVRWWIHLLLLGSYPLALGLIPNGAKPGEATTAVLHSVSGLLEVTRREALFFALLFGVACLFSRVTARQLLLQWRGGFRPVLRGFVYSLGLRFAVGLAVLAAVGLVAVGTGENIQDLAEKARPHTEVLVNASELSGNRLYFILNLTVVSFLLAGLREELWRAGFLAGLGALFPHWYARRRNQAWAVVIAAVIFGLGHYPQGWGGVFMTGLLGLGLGLIMIYHGSIWEAVLAHGFFNATTFAVLWFLAKFRPEDLPPGFR